MNILEILKEVANRMDEPTINDALSTTNEQAIKYLASANKMARYIVKQHKWANLKLDFEFTTVVGERAYALPSDFDGLTTYYLYNDTNEWKYRLNDSDQILNDRTRKNTSWTTAGFRIIRNNIEFTVAAPSVDNFVYTYQSNAFGVNDDNGTITYNDSFKSNDDTFLLDDELLILAIIFDLRKKYGYDVTVSIQEFTERLQELKRIDNGNFIYDDTDPQKAYPYPTNWNNTGD